MHAYIECGKSYFAYKYLYDHCIYFHLIYLCVYIYYSIELFSESPDEHSDAPSQPTVGVDIQQVEITGNDNKTAHKMSLREVGSSMSTRWKSYIPLCNFVVVSNSNHNLNILLT